MAKGFKVSTGAVRAVPILGYRGKPVYIVETSAGRVAVRVHDSDTICAENVSGHVAVHERGERYGQGETEYVAVRGIEYTFSATFSPLDLSGAAPSYFSASRRGSFTLNDVSRPAREALQTIAREAVAHVLDVHGEALAIADALTAHDGMQSATEAVDKARKALADAVAVETSAVEYFGRMVEAVDKRGIDLREILKGRE